MSTEPLENLEELARRAVACKRWRYLEGMRGWREGRRYRFVGHSIHNGQPVWVGWADPESGERCSSVNAPDFTDPTTIDLILPLVRAAWGEAGSCHDAGPRAMWRYYSPRGQLRAEGQSRLRCLVAALEAAP
jgi:hypothetical protein